MSERALRARGRVEAATASARVGALFDAHGRMVLGLCRLLLRDPAEAEDAAQQTFLSAYKALLSGAKPREGEAWLATIARHECLQRIRARMRGPLPVVEVEVEDHRSNVHELVLDRVAAARLWREISRLPQQQRDAVLLREIAGLSYEELGVLLGVTQPAVESLLFRARSHLRDRLRATFASLNVAGLASEAVAAVARLAGSGAAPVAVKAAAVGVGVAVAGGGGIAAERRLELPAAEAQSSRPVTHAAPHRAAGPAPVRVRHPVSHEAPVRVERRASPVVHPAPVPLPVQVALEHHEVEHRTPERADEPPAHRDERRGEHDGGTTTQTQTPSSPSLPTAPSPVERHDEGGGDGPPGAAVTTTVAHDAGTSGEGGHEGPGPGTTTTTTTTVAAPSSSGEASAGDRHGETEGGSAAVVETDGGGGGEEAETSATTTTTTPTTTVTTTTTTTDTEGGESGSGGDGGHPGRH